ncbi:protein suppressor of white apricot isoform X2 [Phlebotomus argentipes]|uniref:protein suppressor of white apricot isoform X2 n=1 Tax=Phlebotomus argentipes TaxID=94469 RepID=UPI002893439C|nr:protein suppressor of white apricot isoform X2 [Phlebotomus argentipes]
MSHGSGKVAFINTQWIFCHSRSLCCVIDKPSQVWYDVRATLNDLKVYEAPPGGYTNRLDYLSPAEQRAEQLCEEERYFSLYHNEREEDFNQEEELKRLQSSSYAQVGFNYDAPAAAAGPEKQSSVEEEEVDEVAFEPSPNFPIPTDIELPPTVKLNAIIEKTARFIAAQGMQMEILIKTKQANNPHFDFLTQNGRFNCYYKFVLAAIKDNRYPSAEADVKASEVAPAVRSDEVPNEGLPAVQMVQKKSLPVLKYKPSADCAYTQLISKITGAPLPVQMTEEAPEVQHEEAAAEPSPAANGATPQLPDNERVEFRRKAESVEVRKISTGLMLAQCYNSESESDEDSNSRNSLFKLDLPVPPDGLQHIIDKTAAYVAKNGKDFEDILRTKQDPRFSFLDESSEYHRYYIYKVTGSIYLPAGKSDNQQPEKVKKEDVQPKIVTPVCFSIKTKDDPPVPMKPALPQEPSSDEEGAEKNGVTPEATTTPTAAVEEKPEPEEESRDLGINVEEILEMEEKKEAKRAEEKVRDKLAAAAREKLGLISKEKQLQLERKKKAMAFLTQIKSSGLVKAAAAANATVAASGSVAPQPVVGNGQNNSDSDVSVHSLPSIVVPDVVEESRSRSRSGKRRTRSRSRSRSSSSVSRAKRKKKKAKHEHAKKKKRKSRSPERKHKKKSSRRRSEERHR